MKPPKKQYIIRKFVMALSMREAVRREKHQPVDEVWVNQDYKPEEQESVRPLGFQPKERNR